MIHNNGIATHCNGIIIYCEWLPWDQYFFCSLYNSHHVFDFCSCRWCLTWGVLIADKCHTQGSLPSLRCLGLSILLSLTLPFFFFPASFSPPFSFSLSPPSFSFPFPPLPPFPSLPSFPSLLSSSYSRKHPWDFLNLSRMATGSLVSDTASTAGKEAIQLCNTVHHLPTVF